MFSSVAHIGFTVSDLDQSVAFYKDILGLTYVGEMFMEGPSTEELFKREGAAARVAYLKTADEHAPLVELIQFSDVASLKDTPSLFKTSISEFCFMVDDIDAEYERLVDLGVKFLSAPQTFDSTEYGFGKSRAVYLFDPDGNILELIQSL